MIQGTASHRNRLRLDAPARPNIRYWIVDADCMTITVAKRSIFPFQLAWMLLPCACAAADPSIGQDTYAVQYLGIEVDDALETIRRLATLNGRTG